mmetsp:Transcript_1403/g.2853  ORF Transcript_1403/g.2853 Transcript_1403/m.2853 type:complete len:81 (-) Transcript_1403:1403-1645(-)
MGPLLYHYADMCSQASVEFTLEEVLYAVEAVGFKLKASRMKDCHYTSDHKSMLEMKYHCSFFVAVKPQVTTNLTSSELRD